jgi:uncharacterized protein YkwD
MLHKVTEYVILSLASFCLFSALFRTVAYAQTPQDEPHAPAAQKTQQLAEQIPPSPTPTVYVQQTQTTQATTSPAPTSTQTQTNEETPAKVTPTPTSVTPTPIKSEPTVAASKAKTTPTPLPVKQVVTPTPVPVVTTSMADQLFSMVNTYRQSKGLPAFIQDDRVCSLANARATEIAAEMAAGTLHSGMYARNLPYWNTENAAAYGSAEADFNWWLGDGIHRQAIESSKTYSCTACSGNYCVQEFTSFQPK